VLVSKGVWYITLYSQTAYPFEDMAADSC